MKTQWSSQACRCKVICADRQRLLLPLRPRRERLRRDSQVRQRHPSDRTSSGSIIRHARASKTKRVLATLPRPTTPLRATRYIRTGPPHHRNELAFSLRTRPSPRQDGTGKVTMPGLAKVVLCSAMASLTSKLSRGAPWALLTR